MGAQANTRDAVFPSSQQVRESGYLAAMVALLASVTIFEAYDVTIFHLCTPDIARTFHLDDRAVGLMASLVRLGGMLAFFVVMLSDRIGRKPIVSVTVLVYALFTGLTAFSRGLGAFTTFQSCAQIFLSAEFAVAIIMVSEEFPDDWRGKGIAALHIVGLLGVVLASFLYGRVVDTHWGWRGMYLIGIAPLLVVAFLRRNLRETLRFERIKHGRGAAPKESMLAGLAQAIAPFRGPHRGRLLLVAVLWNSVLLVGAPAVTFFSLYAKRDRHWTSAQIGSAVTIAYLIGTLGHVLAGWLLDRIGRKSTTALLYSVGAIAIFMLFQSARHDVMLSALIITVSAFQGARTATATYATELFPTEIRATSYGVTAQIFGQLAGFIAPMTIGMLSKSLGGLGNAVAAFSAGPLIGALVVLIFAPETRGLRLEEAAAAAAD